MKCDPDVFALHYRGPHSPADALHWLTAPDEPGPSGALPPQALYLRLAEEQEAAGCHDTATAVLDACAELLAYYRRLALDAFSHCSGESDLT